MGISFVVIVIGKFLLGDSFAHTQSNRRATSLCFIYSLQKPLLIFILLFYSGGPWEERWPGAQDRTQLSPQLRCRRQRSWCRRNRVLCEPQPDHSAERAAIQGKLCKRQLGRLERHENLNIVFKEIIKFSFVDIFPLGMPVGWSAEWRAGGEVPRFLCIFSFEFRLIVVANIGLHMSFGENDVISKAALLVSYCSVCWWQIGLNKSALVEV